MSDQWITITSCTYPHDAQLAKCHLEADGIAVQLADENTVSVHNFYSQAVGGVKVKVRASDAQRAAEILNLRINLPARAPICPGCDSSETRRANPSWMPVVLALVLQPLLLLFMEKRWECHACNRVFRESEAKGWSQEDESVNQGSGE